MTLSDGSSLARAAGWVEALVQGPVMTAAAVLAIAGVGFAMLGGRLSVRRGVTVVLGCFIAFGAPAIARGLMGMAQEQAPVAYVPPPIDASPPSLDPSAPAAPRVDADPYAGASVRN